uniref:MOSC domain-containing protein n=1 Tax=Panagrolaimus davidi TaxID=227884 RepID=A0A914Q6D8_9BILA
MVLSKPAIIASATGVAASLAYLFYLRQQRTLAKNYWCSEFIEAGEVSKIFVYPVKSCKPLIVDCVETEQRGIRYGENHDRQFILVDAAHNYLLQSGRQYPKMVVLENEVKDGFLHLRTPEGKTFSLNIQDVINRNDVRVASIFNNEQEGLDCGDEVGHFFEEYLGTKDNRQLRLLYFTADLSIKRDLKSDDTYWKNPVPEVEDTPMFHDQSAFNFMNESSVEDLNEKLEQNGLEKVSVQNFRPTFAISGLKAFEEDRWLQVKVGEAEFTCYSPCTRCVLTTVNPATGVMDLTYQPLKTLREYRLAPEGKLREKYTQSPVFGVYAVSTKNGKIKVGDKVLVKYKPSPL